MSLRKNSSASVRVFGPILFAVLLLAVTLPVFAQAPPPLSSHVILIIDENTSYDTTLSQMPWLVSQGNTYGHATNFVSNTAGSLMDYLWLASGSCESSASCTLPAGTHNFNCNGNDCSSPITDDNIFREMTDRGISWKVYAQSYAAAGGTVTTPDNANGTHYYRRHNGATWYSDILSNVDGAQSKIVDFSEFATDLANDALPQFTIIAPDGLHDDHDGTPAQGDAFLDQTLTPVLAKPYFQAGGDGLIVITFDNGDADAQGQVYTAFLGPLVRHGFSDGTFYQHQNTLRTMLEALGITTYPGASANAGDMKNFFASGVYVASPQNNSTTTTDVLVNASATDAGSQVYQIQVWDNGIKVAEGPLGSSIKQRLTLATGQHQLVVEDLASGTYQTLHKQTLNLTVSGNGVVVNSPAPNSVSGTQVLVKASATESTNNIYMLQVWDNTTGQKLADGPLGSIVNQTLNLSPGQHQLVVEDIAIGTYATIHKTTVDINVSDAPGVTVVSPANNSTQNGTVYVKAYANSSTAIDHMEVWDATGGKKLGDIPGSQVDQAYTVSSGTRNLVIQSISAGNFQILNKVTVTVNVE